MTATNHAITGALIGLAIGSPVLAIPLAFASHFVLDAIPHYSDANDELTRLRTKLFWVILVIEPILCALIVLLLALFRPENWVVAAFSAFSATSPDLFWIKKFVVAKKQKKLLPNKNPFWRFHSFIQWCAKPWGAWVEALWFFGLGSIFIAML